jgi:hypothetical protein
MKPKKMESKFPGACVKCKGFMPVGGMIMYQKGVGAWHHGACPEVPEPMPLKELVAVGPEERWQIERGAILRVYRGKKVPVGVEGVCIWHGPGNYGARVGIKVEGQEEIVWCSASNCEVLAKVALVRQPVPVAA